MIKASELIKWCKTHVGHGYVYGSIGQTCTIPLLMQLQKQYGASMGDGYYQKGGDYTKGRCGKWLGKWCADCSGLIKAGRKALENTWRDVSAQGTYDQCTKRGAIGSMQMIPGCTLYMYSKEKGRMGHVGIYIGDGMAIEARGADYGIVITRLSERAWGYWGLLDWLEHDIKDENWKPVVGSQVDAGDSTNAKPDDLLTLAEAVKFIDSKVDISETLWSGTDSASKAKHVDLLLQKIATKWKKG